MKIVLPRGISALDEALNYKYLPHKCNS